MTKVNIYRCYENRISTSSQNDVSLKMICWVSESHWSQHHGGLKVTLVSKSLWSQNHSGLKVTLVSKSRWSQSHEGPKITMFSNTRYSHAVRDHQPITLGLEGRWRRKISVPKWRLDVPEQPLVTEINVQGASFAVHLSSVAVHLRALWPCTSAKNSSHYRT